MAEIRNHVGPVSRKASCLLVLIQDIHLNIIHITLALPRYHKTQRTYSATHIVRPESLQLNPNMAARGPTGARGGSSRFAQFKLVLLGTWKPFQEKRIAINITYRGICCRKGNVHPVRAWILMLISVIEFAGTSIRKGQFRYLCCIWHRTD